MLSRLAIKIQDYAKKGISWLEAYLKDECGEEVYISGLFFRKSELQKTLDMLECIVNVQSDQELDDYIEQDTIPMGLLHNEQFWKEFDSFISVWLGDYSDLLDKNMRLNNSSFCKMSADNTLYIGMNTIYQFTYMRLEIILASESYHRVEKDYNKGIRIFKYDEKNADIEEVITNDEYLYFIKRALIRIGREGEDGGIFEESRNMIRETKKKYEQKIREERKLHLDIK